MKGFDAGVVLTIAFAAHTALHPLEFQTLLVFVRGVLAATIRMMKHWPYTCALYGISTLSLASYERPFLAKHSSPPFVTSAWFWGFHKAVSTAHRFHRSDFSDPCGGGSVCSSDASTTDNNRSEIRWTVGTSSGPKTRSGVHGWTGTLLPVVGEDAHGFF